MVVDVKTYQLLDANLNRAREGLRVVEDTARFLWKDAELYQTLRLIRHRLHKLTATRYKVMLDSRDSVQDAGRTIKEGPRMSIGDLAAANMRRAEEAVRVLEEYSKVFSRNAAPEFKKIRYQLYTAEKKFLKRI